MLHLQSKTIKNWRKEELITPKGKICPPKTEQDYFFWFYYEMLYIINICKIYKDTNKI